MRSKETTKEFCLAFARGWNWIKMLLHSVSFHSRATETHARALSNTSWTVRAAHTTEIIYTSKMSGANGKKDVNLAWRCTSSMSVCAVKAAAGVNRISVSFCFFLLLF